MINHSFTQLNDNANKTLNDKYQFTTIRFLRS